MPSAQVVFVRFATALCSLSLGLCACSSGPSDQSRPVAPSVPPKPYVIPAEFSLKPVAERGPAGEIYISGTTNFPDGMKMWVIVGPKKAQQDAFVRGGRFRSGPLYDNVPTPISGNQTVEFLAYFNGAWQDKRILAALGEGGKNLRGRLFKVTDPDVIDSGRILDAKFTLPMPPIPPEVNAISIVKHAVLRVPGLGRSDGTIEQNIALFIKPGTGVKPAKGWSATATGKTRFDVAYDFIDGSAGDKQAIWAVDTATKQVKYINEAAKLLSWTPKD